MTMCHNDIGHFGVFYFPHFLIPPRDPRVLRAFAVGVWVWWAPPIARTETIRVNPCGSVAKDFFGIRFEALQVSNVLFRLQRSEPQTRPWTLDIRL